MLTCVSSIPGSSDRLLQRMVVVGLEQVTSKLSWGARQLASSSVRHMPVPVLLSANHLSSVLWQRFLSALTQAAAGAS